MAILVTVADLVTHFPDRCACPDQKVDEISVTFPIETLRRAVTRRSRGSSYLIAELPVLSDLRMPCVLQHQTPQLRAQLPRDEFFVIVCDGMLLGHALSRRTSRSRSDFEENPSDVARRPSRCLSYCIASVSWALRFLQPPDPGTHEDPGTQRTRGPRGPSDPRTFGPSDLEAEPPSDPEGARPAVFADESRRRQPGIVVERDGNVARIESVADPRLGKEVLPARAAAEVGE
jgi:hypothetical protein